MAKEKSSNTGEIELAPDSEECGRPQDGALDALLAKPVQQVGGHPVALTQENEAIQRIEGIVIGRLINMEEEDSGRMMVDWPGNTESRLMSSRAPSRMSSPISFRASRST